MYFLDNMLAYLSFLSKQTKKAFFYSSPSRLFLRFEGLIPKFENCCSNFIQSLFIASKFYNIVLSSNLLVFYFIQIRFIKST